MMSDENEPAPERDTEIYIPRPPDPENPNTEDRRETPRS